MSAPRITQHCFLHDGCMRECRGVRVRVIKRQRWVSDVRCDSRVDPHAGVGAVMAIGAA